MRKIAQIIRGLAVPKRIPSWAFGPPLNHEKSGMAGLRARRLWWHSVPAGLPQQQDAGATKRVGCVLRTLKWRVGRALLLLHRLKACATNLFPGGALLVPTFSEKARNHRERINERYPGIIAQIFPGKLSRTAVRRRPGKGEVHVGPEVGFFAGKSRDGGDDLTLGHLLAGL